MRILLSIISLLIIFKTAGFAGDRTLSYEKERLLFITKLSNYQASNKFVQTSFQANANESDQSFHCLVGTNFEEKIIFNTFDGVFNGFTYLNNDTPESTTASYSMAFNSNSKYGDVALGASLMYESDSVEDESDYFILPVLCYNYEGNVIDLKSRFLSGGQNPASLKYYYVEPGAKLTEGYAVYPSFAVNNIDDENNHEMRQVSLRQELNILDTSVFADDKNIKSYIKFRFDVDNTYNEYNMSFNDAITDPDFYTYTFEFEFMFYLGLWYSKAYGKGFGFGTSFTFYTEEGNEWFHTHIIYKNNRIYKDPIADRQVGDEFDILVTMNLDFGLAEQL